MNTRLIVIYLTGSPDLDGQWREIDLNPLEMIRYQDPSLTVSMIPTGNLEWRDYGACAEVWVPADRLAEWRAEHDLERG